MAIALQGLYNQSHQFSAGIVNINAPFVGNVLAIEVTTKPEYLPNTQVVGYLYQHYGEASNGYALKSGKAIISLELPESSSLSFIPTPYLSDTYTLSIKYATVGAVIDGENTVGLPQQILDLPNNVQAIDLQLVNIENAITELEQSIPTWETLTGKPQTFSPSSHNHVKADITDLSLGWGDITDKPSAFAPSSHNHVKADITDLFLGWGDITDKPSTFPPSSHTHTADQIQGLSGLGGSSYIALSSNQTLESNKKYLATVNNLVCSLPANPAIGDWIEISNANFSSFRINHGNILQSILNNQTQSTAGSTDSGIILKPYGVITLVFIGANLWISGAKHRTINNWLNIALETTASPKNYTLTVDTFGLSAMNDGSESTNTNPNVADAWATCSLSGSHFIDSFRLITGQSNGWFNYPTQFRVYAGSGISGQLLGDFPINQETQVFTLNQSFQGNLVTVRFSRSGAPLTIKDLKINTRSVTGGEISVV